MQSDQKISQKILRFLSLKNSSKSFRALLVAIVFLINTFSAQSSYATIDYGVGRLRTCDATGNTEGLDFNPFSGGKDVEFVLANPICLTVIATAYTTVKVAIYTMDKVCGIGGGMRATPSPILDAIDISRASAKAFSNPSCAAAVATAVSSVAIAMITLGGIYSFADDSYNTTRICGSNWLTPNPATYNISVPTYKNQVETTIKSYIATDKTRLTLNDKTYREWYYGGVEVEDNPDNGDACLDVTQAKINGQYPRQKYYMRGLEAGNFNCKKYDVNDGMNDPLTNKTFTTDRLAEFQTAYQCCKNRSAKFICIESFDPDSPSQKVKAKFCQGGTRCDIDLVTFATKYLDNGRLICAESYSVCPYNFAIGGGTEYCDYYKDGKWDDTQGRWIMITEEDIANSACKAKSEIRNDDCTFNNKAGQCKNYCQYLRHCSKTTDMDFRYQSSLTSPYFSTACLNFVGDSRNQTSYSGQRHFSAPIAQCVKETMENVFYDRVGHTVCKNYGEPASSDGSCPSGQYANDGTFIQKIGNHVKSQSFFAKLQDSLQLIVKLVITLAVVFYGMKTLLGVGELKKSELLLFITKIGLVIFFATDVAWQSMFFDGVYNSSSEFSRMVFKINVSSDELKRDGCQFGEMTFADGINIATGTSYPAGKEYLAIWDTLDCKIARYLGFGPEASVANIAKLIFAGFFTGAYGIYFAIGVMFFGFFLIAATIRALHIFLSSAMSIILMVYISPVIIPTVLFGKTSNIFKGWVTNLISFCLQPMILFAYIAIFITVMDKTLIGSATFHGAPYSSGSSPVKVLSCDNYCENLDGTISDNAACDGTGQTVVKPINDSIACLININDFGKFPGLEIIGVSFPVIVNIFKENTKEKILTLIKGAFVMYILCKFMDEIPAIASQLVGGKLLPSSSMNPMAKVRSLLEEIQKRGTRGLKKQGISKAKESRDYIKQNQSGGKSIKKDDDGGGEGDDGDRTGRSKGAQDDSSGSGGREGDDSSGK